MVSLELQPTRVVLADDSIHVRAGVKTILESQGDIKVVAEANNGHQALKLVEEIQPDVLILDIEMPVCNGLQVVEILKQKGATLPILAISAYDDHQYILEMLKNGVAGYLTKDEVPDILIDAVHGVAKGEYGWISRRIARKLLSLILDADLEDAKLTAEEKRTLALISAYTTNQNSDRNLNISDSSTRRHVQKVFDKLNRVPD